MSRQPRGPAQLGGGKWDSIPQSPQRKIDKTPLVEHVPEGMLSGTSKREKEAISRGYLAFARFRQQEQAALSQSAQEGHGLPPVAAPRVIDFGGDRVGPLYIPATGGSLPAGKPLFAASLPCRRPERKKPRDILHVQVPKAIREMLDNRVAELGIQGDSVMEDCERRVPNTYAATAPLPNSVSQPRALAPIKPPPREIRRAATGPTPTERIGMLNTPTANIRTAYRDSAMQGSKSGSRGLQIVPGMSAAPVPSPTAPSRQRQYLALEDFDSDETDQRSPAEWVALGRRNGGVPAYSRFFCHEARRTEWRPCRVVSYNQVTSTFTVVWERGGGQKQVKRLNLIFMGEDVTMWRHRYAEAQRRRQETEAQFRLQLYVNSIDDSVAAPLSEDRIDRILAIAAREYPVYSLALVDRFIDRIKQEYTRSMKLAIHLYKYQSIPEQIRLAPLGLPPAPRKKKVQSLVKLRATVRTPSPNFTAARLFILDNLFFVHPLLQTLLRTLHLMWSVYRADLLCDVEFSRASIAFPCELKKFEEVQLQRNAIVVERLRDEWSAAVAATIQHHLETFFNFYEEDMSRYRSSRMQRFVSIVNVMMNTQLRELVMASVQVLTAFFLRYQAITDDVLALPIANTFDSDGNAQSRLEAEGAQSELLFLSCSDMIQEGLIDELSEDAAEREFWEAKGAARVITCSANSQTAKTDDSTASKAAPGAKNAPLKRKAPAGSEEKHQAESGTGSSQGNDSSGSPTAPAEPNSVLPFPPYRSNKPLHARVLAMTMKPTGMLPLFVIHLVAEGELITFSPPLEEFKERLLAIFDMQMASVSQMHGIGDQLFPLLSLEQYYLRPLTECEPVIIRSRNIVRAVLKRNEEAPRELAQLYGCFEYILKTDTVALLERVSSRPRVELLEEYDLALERLERDLDRIQQRTPNIVRYELYTVECDGLKKDLTEKGTALKDALLSHLAARLHEDCTEAIHRYEQIYERIAFEPRTPEELQELMDYIDNVPNEEVQLNATLGFITNGHELLVRYEHLVSSTMFLSYWTAFEWPKKLHQRLDMVQYRCKEFRNVFQQRLRENCEKLTHNLTILSNEVDEFTHLGDDARAEEYYRRARAIEATLHDCQSHVALYNSHQTLFNQPLAQWPQLKEIKTLFEPHHTLWEIVYLFNAEHERWLNARIASLSPREIDNQIGDWTRKLMVASKRITEAEPSEVVKQLRVSLEEFKRIIPLLYALRSNLQASHWRAIFQACGIPREKQGGPGGAGVEANESRTLNEFLKLSMLDHITAIESIAAVAQKTFDLESELLSMESEWRKLMFETDSYMDTFKLKVNDVMQQILDEHMIKTQSMLGKPIVRQSPHVQARVVQWEKQLNNIQYTLDEWFRCQNTWAYLEPIFSSADIARSLPAEKQKFMLVDENWHKIMEVTRSTPQILTRCQDESLLQILAENNRVLEHVLRKLQQFLETKRMAFPRFYFISNEELLQILSDSKDPHLVQPYLSKCFEGIKRIRFTEENDIVGMESVEGEYVEFSKRVNPATFNNQVELWLQSVEAVMKDSIREQLRLARDSYPKEERTQFVQHWPGQVVIAVCSMFWTMEATQAMEEEGTLGLTAYRETCTKQLDNLIVLVRDRTLASVTRCTLEALVVIEVHARDIIVELSEKGVDSPNAFDWLAQLRYYWEEDHLAVSQINATLRYGYEYLGNTGRLVITQLTDRCYRTLMGALHLNYGGAPEGPAGTGKTETTKDLAKALGKYCVVYNCSDQITSKDMAKLFKGLSQSGSWGCFDEFNRIEVQVLSVIAQQVASIQDAIAQKLTEFVFDGGQIRLDPGCAVFITMNPGYAGRAELPDNLKALFRPVAMMVPNYAMIGEIQLYSYGFLNGRTLAGKIVATYRLCSEQLSSQDHYDYGMRAVKAVLTAAGRLKRQYPDEDESILMLRSIKDVNLPKFLAQDVELFNGIISDLFPGITLPPPDYHAMHEALATVCASRNLQLTPYFEQKIRETYEMIVVRHGMMLVGYSFGGKTKILQCLSEALGIMQTKGLENRTRLITMNPKAVTMAQLYGKVEQSGEWTDGILSNRFRQAAQDTTVDRKWIILDGPVDAIWIENMNTVLDDNKKLCLQNGDIIPMSKQMSMIFEVQDLAHASPATVSRCGMVYVEPERLGWECLVKSYCNNVPVALARSEQGKRAFTTLVELLIPPMLEVVRKKTKTVIPQQALTTVAGFLKLFHSFVKTLGESSEPQGSGGGAGGDGGKPARKVKSVDDGGDVVDGGAAATAEGPLSERDLLMRIEGWFLFGVVWGIGGCLFAADRAVFNEELHELLVSITSQGEYKFTVPLIDRKQSYYDVHFSVADGEVRFVDWVDTVDDVIIPESSEFQDIIVPTGDTAKYTFLASTMIANSNPLLLVGDTGTGKTLMVKSLLGGLPKASFVVNSIQFSAQTSASSTQQQIDARCERRRKGHYGPPINKRMVVFVDDANLPQLELYGAQPPIELLRQLLDSGGWYNHSKESIEFWRISDVQLICAMGPTGGGRNPVTQRFVRHFNSVAVPSFDQTTLKKVFLALADWTLTRGFPSSLRSSSAPLVSATIELYETLVRKLKPTPEKSHYTFNMRDISKVFQGISMANPAKIADQRKLCLLWLHEVSRAFADRFIVESDTQWFLREADRVMMQYFKIPSTVLRPSSSEPVIFSSFMSDQGFYEEIEDLSVARKVLEDRLEAYNFSTRSGSLDLVVFQYVIEHVARICRVLKQSSGNLLLIGVGGSGRRSCAKLAAYLQECEYDTIAAAKNYQRTDFHDDIRRILLRTGMNGYSVVFALCDTQITDDAFLEDICSLLNTGEVPGLWDSKQDKDTLDNAVASLRDIGKDLGRADTTEALQELFVERCKKYLHIVLCFSPVGKVLRERLRRFPALVNCTTIDWFREWPEEGLDNVAQRFLSDVPDLSVAEQDAIREIFVAMHGQVGNLCATYLQDTRQHTYVTPTSYLELLNTFVELLVRKREELTAMRRRYDNGLMQLNTTEDDVKVMQAELALMQPELAKKQKETDQLIQEVERESKVAEQQRALVAVDEAAANEQAAAAKAIKDVSQAKVNEAQPLVEQAQRAVLDLDPKALQEVKALKAPPQGVKYVIEVLCTLLGGTYKPKPVRDPLTGKTNVPYWEHAKLTLLTGEFKNILLNAYPVIVDSAPDDQIEEVKKKMASEMFQMENIRKTSVALVGVATYVKAVVEYYKQNKIIKPLLAQAAAAQQEFDAAIAALNKKKEELRIVNEKLAALTAHLEQVRLDQQELERKVADTDTKLTRARKLIEGLSGEKARYMRESERFAEELKLVVGDVVASSGVVAYLGPFLHSYRERMMQTWLAMCKERGVVGSERFSLSRFLGSPIEIQEWKLQQLPTDSFSVDNAVIMRNSSRWPLLVDPQQQANNWIRNLESKNSLVVVRPTEENYLATIRRAVQDGVPLLLENVEEDIDPTLENLLLRRFTKEGNMLAVHIGEPVMWNPSFRLYMTTKLPRPHYRPEVCSMVTLINFVITQQGLQDQLLQRVMMSERRDIEEKKQALTIEAANNQAGLKETEDTILAILSSEGSILESEAAIEELDRSKVQSDRIAKRQEEIEATERVSNKTRALFVPAAELGATLFFCVTELANIDPMYQYSLQFYMNLFQAALADSPRSDSVEERIINIKETFQESLYRTVCRSLFGKDQLLFSFTMTLRILNMNLSEVRWLLLGGFEQDRGLPANPFASWLPDISWRAVWRASTQLPETFSELPQLVAQHEAFFTMFNEAADPLSLEMPEELQALSGFHRLILMRCFRMDKIVPAVMEYVRDNLGDAFVEPSLFNLETIVTELADDPSIPVIFVLSPGADPNVELDRVAEMRGMQSRFFKLSLGQGQDTMARDLIESGKRKGHWVLLQNCHLYQDFMPSMARLIEEYSRIGIKETLHRDFRLWLTSLPSEVFPISVLQNGVKLVQEPPKGLRSNLLRSYLSDPIADHEFFESSTKPEKWTTLLFGLCFFHSLVQERRSFGPLGWNTPYEFNDTDLRISIRQLKMFLEESEVVPYEALLYLTGQCNYGGRITDDWDRRCAMAILEVFYNPTILEEGYTFSADAPEYFAPPFDDYDLYLAYIQELPLKQSPYIFGLHSNADITKDEREARQLLDATLTSLPKDAPVAAPGKAGAKASSGGESPAVVLDPKTVVMQLAKDVAARLPPLFDTEAVQQKYPILYEESMNTVLLQEIIRYNRLLAVVRRTVVDVQDAINGTVVMSADLEQVFGAMFDGKVPELWRRRSYPSLKPFGAYVDDFIRRLEFLRSWIDHGPPPMFWLSGFFFTQSFLTGVMQNYARRRKLEIDKLVWDFTVMTEDRYDASPPDGCYIYGLFLEGAGWNKELGYLCESRPKELFISFPVLRLTPVCVTEVTDTLHYVCPCYKTTDRRGTLSTTGHSTNFILAIHLPRHVSESESHWIMRGTALFTQLNF